MDIFLTGATGFVGSRLTARLLEAGHHVQALVRPASLAKLSPELRRHPNLEILEGDLLDEAALRGIGRRTEAVVHLAGLLGERRRRGQTFERVHIEGTRRLLRALSGLSSPRIIFVSTIGAREQAQSRFHRSKYRAEHWIKLSGLPWVIFRPSLVFGRGCGFVERQGRFIRSFLPVIVPGRGRILLQPLAVENLVEALMKALTDPQAVGQIFEAGGPDRLSLNAMIDLIAEAKGAVSYVKVYFPMALLRPLATLLQYLPFFPMDKDQIVRLQEDNICQTRRFYEHFGLEPRSVGLETLAEPARA